MNEKFIVPYYIAEKLHNLGFDQCSDFMYDNDKTLCKRYRGQCIEAPSYEEVIDYFSRIYNIQIGINIYNFPDNTYEYSAYVVNGQMFKTTKHYKKREESYNEAFEIILNEMIKEN